MATEQITQPLRISKTPTPSPTKAALPRPLSEIPVTEMRRNSPSFNQSPNKKLALHTDSSPFQSSPLDGTTSPRLFWHNRHVANTTSENDLYGGRSGSPSPTRRSSIERLQKASRVKNSTMFAREQKQEYDPARVLTMERPLSKIQGNAFSGTNSPFRPGHGRSESQTNIPEYSPTKSVVTSPTPMAEPRTPSKDQASPIKSSLSSARFRGSHNSENTEVSVDDSFDDRELPAGKALHRYAKSVTFDAAPPQINEYEMATPDISSIGSNSREGSYESFDDDDDDEYRHYPGGERDLPDDSFDASLEDTDKTPVVGPEDWRQDLDHRFDSSPMPESKPATAAAARPQHGRSNSATSSAEHRPLPPLPGMSPPEAQSPGLASTAERMLGSQGSPRTLPSPPAATASKSEIQNIGHGKMSLEERLKLMMLSDETSPKGTDQAAKSIAEQQQRERRMRRAGARDRLASPTPERETSMPVLDADEAGEADDTLGDLSAFDIDYQLPSISRQSILNRVNGNSDYNFGTPAPDSSPARGMNYDPDVPIASIEESIIEEAVDGDESVIIHPVQDDKADVSDLYDGSDDDDVSSMSDSDTDSHYSDDGDAEEQYTEEEVATTPRAGTPVDQHAPTNFSASLPQVNSHSSRDSDFSRSFQTYMLPKPKESGAVTHQETHRTSDNHEQARRPRTPEKFVSKPEYDGSGWGEPEEDEEPGTPESVIHHPMSDDDDEYTDDEPIESPAVPEEMATIKASGSKLKTRPSATPADLAAMREQRRIVSREVPPIPDKHRARLSRDFATDRLDGSTNSDYLERHPSFKKSSLTLDLDLGLSLDQDFDRVIEAQKVGNPVIRGYLMRQNTKLVAASDRPLSGGDSDIPRNGTRSAGNSPVKQQRPQSWTVEPWNGKVRHSIKRRHGPSLSGPVPPLPGQESNAVAITTVKEETPESAIEDSGERGRLFVKVMGVKDLDLPLPKNERTWFSLTLDNGVHCVTTAWLELARNAPIGQEFELVVPNDLEFQLTLNVKLEKPEPQQLPPSPTKVSRPKPSTFSRVFASPKKRKEMEARMKAEEEAFALAQREAVARQRKTAPSSWDLLSPIAAEDGSFARSYVCLKEHEARCYGRPYMAEIAAFNEWATEEANFASSVKSKRNDASNSVVRKAPYKVGKLEVQLLFVPRPKGATDDDMPKSMNSCIRELKASEERLRRNWEGPLSQQGGDCPYWRRRYFKLVGTKLTAYHEATRQPRATINLANCKRLIDDRRQLMDPETTGKGGRRRRSAFAEEEEGYMFVEEGFRIRFNNGELIDFYADTPEDKEGWMKVLGDIIGRGGGEDDDGATSSRKKWCDLVLKREEALRKRAEGKRVHSRTKSMII
ncbi:cell division protein anillin-domain-containing protein [Microdochium bolleyi]|uniref:Cell division protein anillin-domain-containing protein n=1 Tax=Microdochium bolleyi TaxID=196109 RepID=A0A136JBW7_9PEZI|nr:cell division protein anillin-domain-containing protein [Microdochium bolleyi]